MMKNNWIVQMGLGLACLSLTPVFADQHSARWFSQQQVEQGAKVFQNNCAACHSKNAESTANWREKLPNGKYPAPPLNGSAHAWHHTKKSLREQVLLGGDRYGGWMPSFKDRLNIKEIDSAIAYFQSKWSDKIYSAWVKRDTGTDINPVKSVPKPKSPIPLGYLEGFINSKNIELPIKTPVDGVYQTKVNDKYLYLSKDGRYLFFGQLIDLKTKKSLTEQAMKDSQSTQ